MRDVEKLLRRQAEWQKSRRSLSWPEKIRMAEQARDTIEAFGAQRRARKPQSETEQRTPDQNPPR